MLKVVFGCQTLLVLLWLYYYTWTHNFHILLLFYVRNLTTLLVVCLLGSIAFFITTRRKISLGKNLDGKVTFFASIFTTIFSNYESAYRSQTTLFFYGAEIYICAYYIIRLCMFVIWQLYKKVIQRVLICSSLPWKNGMENGYKENGIYMRTPLFRLWTRRQGKVIF